MNLLVVDDQPDVVGGILSGIPWEALKIHRAYGAHSAQEAKAILEREAIDILLCDIEMPGESGLELLAWVKDRYEEVGCIFLTAHANFKYAHKALQLGAADYLLQPASYTAIADAVERVAQRLQEERTFQSYCSLGQDAMKEQHSFQRTILWEFLQGHQQDLLLVTEKLTAFGWPCAPSQSCGTLWIEFHQWDSAQKEKWDTERLLFAMQNILGELLEEISSQVMVLKLEEASYFMVCLFPGENRCPQGEEMSFIGRQITLFQRHCLEIFSAQTACYYHKAPGLFSQLPQACRELGEAKRENVAQRPGVYPTPETTFPPVPLPDMAPWKSLLAQGHGQAVAEQIHRFFQEAEANRTLSRELLKRFHEDFLQIFFSCIQGYQESAHTVFTQTYDYEAMLQASESLPRLLEFVDFCTRCIEEKSALHTGEQAQIDRILEFIKKNITKNIGRGEVAKAVYLNPEYLSRLFKKEMGIGLSEYLVQEKMKIAQALLKSTGLSISHIASKVGYINFSHFARAFKKEFGLSPTEYRKQGEENQETL